MAGQIFSNQWIIRKKSQKLRSPLAMRRRVYGMPDMSIEVVPHPLANEGPCTIGSPHGPRRPKDSARTGPFGNRGASFRNGRVYCRNGTSFVPAQQHNRLPGTLNSSSSRTRYQATTVAGRSNTHGPRSTAGRCRWKHRVWCYPPHRSRQRRWRRSRRCIPMRPDPW